MQQQGVWGRERRQGRPVAGGRNRRAWDWRCARLPGVVPTRWSAAEPDPEPAPDFHSGVIDLNLDVPDFHSGDYLGGPSDGEGFDFHSEDSEGGE